MRALVAGWSIFFGAIGFVIFAARGDFKAMVIAAMVAIFANMMYD